KKVICLAVEVSGQVVPARVHRLDQRVIPGTPPLLERMFAVAGICDQIAILAPDQMCHTVASRKSGV
ncbi:hypothetical protein, partial [Methylobacterium frigidaeris]|uniref:hypothetical protein n=1 Tax=Methylobacterium frigidaeris TaxID=2038277 RepID=UPI003CC83915